MSQDHSVKERTEEAAHARKDAREETAERRDEAEQILHNKTQLHVDDTTGHKSGTPTAESRLLIPGDQVKQVYELLPNWHKDELRKIAVVAPGTQLDVADTFIDLRDLGKGEFRATGDELVAGELFVSKRETSYDVWDRLVRQDV
jgi:hypothetical protein